MSDQVSGPDSEMTCEVCGRTFASRDRVQEHLREDHDMDPPADLDPEAEDPKPAELYGAGPSTGEPPAAPTQHGA
jgi:hypothetical protein